MLLFSTMLGIKNTMTEHDFIQLLIDANQDHDNYKQNIIPKSEINWDGKETKNTFKYENLLLETLKYRNKDILAAKFEKKEPDGKIWKTDYVWNIPEQKISIRLDRTYSDDASATDEEFSAPSFIKHLVRGGYLEDDGDLPISTEPVMISEDNIDLLLKAMIGSAGYDLPVVYVSKMFDDNKDPLDTARLADRLRGVAHVLVEEDEELDYAIRHEAEDKKTYDGAVSIYFPNTTFPLKRLNRRHEYDDKEAELIEQIRNNVLRFMNSREIPFLYTWDGVEFGVTYDTSTERKEERDKALKDNEEIYEASREDDDKVKKLQEENRDIKNRYEMLYQENERLRSQNEAMLNRDVNIGSTLDLSLGEEQEFFPDEAKEIVLEAIQQTLPQYENQKRRYDILKAIVDGNECPDILTKKGEKITELLKSYDGMDGRLEKELSNLGLHCIRKDKHLVFQYYDDPRYSATLAATPGSQKSGKNTVDDIKRDIF